jgi:Integrase core domain.
MDSFSTFVGLFPVRRSTSTVVCDILEMIFFTSFGVPKSNVSDNAKASKSKVFYDFVFQVGY